MRPEIARIMREPDHIAALDKLIEAHRGDTAIADALRIVRAYLSAHPPSTA
jgi:hypothetical protein